MSFTSGDGAAQRGVDDRGNHGPGLVGPTPCGTIEIERIPL